MATLDLKPLTKETIHKMGFNNHDLWLVKINVDVFGPFESQTLKEYAALHEELFDGALASRLDTGDFQPFWTHAVFGRRSPQIIKHESHQGSFWLLYQGQKQGPYNYQDIDKKIEMGLLALTDHISTDDGHRWKKVFEIEGLDRRTHTGDELPVAPLEASFQKAKLLLIEKMDRPHHNPQEELANLAHQGHLQGKVLTLKLDELTLNTLKNTEVSSAFKWALPVAMAFVVTMVTGGYFILNPSESPMLAEEDSPKEFYQASAPNPSAQLARPAAVIPKPSMPARREPASVRPVIREERPFHQDPPYPTEIETHAEFHQEEPERLPVDDPMNDMMMEEETPKEHSLVSQPQQQDDHSLDAAMNGVVQPVEPIIEEASDF